MAYSPKSQKDYNDKCKVVRIKYVPTELMEYNRLQRYLQDNKINVTEYLKPLIKADLDKKGISYD